jgi:hypothetical protein
MAIGIFSNVARSYIRAAENNWRYLGHTSWFIKFPVFFITALYSIILLIIGLIFYMGILIDILGRITDWIRKLILNTMKKQSHSIDNGFFSFLFRPLLLIVLSPFLLVSLFIPKLSSEPIAEFITSESSQALDGAGTFGLIKSMFWQTASRNLFYFVSNTYLLLKPITALIAVVYSILFIIIGFFFALLIPLDFISFLIESLRQKIARIAHKLANSICDSFFKFLFVSPLLMVLAPIFILLLIIPKITSQLPDS